MREIRIGIVGDSVLCWGEWWETICSTIVCFDMCFIRYVSWKKKTREKQHLSTSLQQLVQILKIVLGVWTHWGVRPAAHAAAVRLGVFDGMCRQVDLQRGRVRIGTVTVGTFEGLVFVVLPLVRLRKNKMYTNSSHIHAALLEALQPQFCYKSIQAGW